MSMTRRQFVTGAGAAAATMTLAACGANDQDGAGGSDGSATTAAPLAFDAAAWSYDADDDVYYQLGVAYCATPADESYEQLAIFVPGAYLSSTDNGDGTYTCEVDETATVGAYTPATAPIVMPINTPGYSAQAALTSYSSFTEYTGEGFVYVHAGCRGRDAGAPAGVTDLKAAVRFMRQFSDRIPASTDRIFTFGMSGGGAQSALMGATGDAAEYEPYLAAIGAVEGGSDAVMGSMDWCPITGLDVADAAYEWMMGCTRTDLSEDDKAISDGLAEAFAAYVNDAGIQDKDGAVLTLEESDDGIYQAGSYYDRVKAAIETSLNDFLATTEFPYDASAASQGGMGGFGGGAGGPGGGGMRGGAGGPGGGRPDGDGTMGGPGGGGMRGGDAAGGDMPDFDGAPDGDMPDFGDAQDADGEGTNREFRGPDGSTGGPGGGDGASVAFEDMDDISRSSSASALVSLSGTYDTAAAYIAACNATDELGTWITYDEATNTATVSSVEAFVRAFKPVSKELGAFDQLDRGQGENVLFGNGDGEGLHFDQMLANVLDRLGSDYAADYDEDLAFTDDEGSTQVERVEMYTPLYYLLASAAGYQTSQPAPYWRIRSGIAQSDTSLTTELNLAMALENDDRVKSVDFAAVWGQKHVEAERTGSATDNFVAWVNDCLA